MDPQNKSLKALFWRTEFYGAITEGGTASLHNGKIGGLLKLGHKCAYASSGPMVLPKEVNYYYIPYGKFIRNLPEVLHLAYNPRSIKAMRKIIETEQPDFIYQQHHDFHYGGGYLRKKDGIPFILHADAHQYFIKKNWSKLYFSSLLKWAEDIQLSCADAIITPSQALKNQLAEFGVDADKIYPAPNGVDPDIFTPEADGSRIRKALGIENNFVVGYAGSFGYWHGTKVLAESVKFILKMIPSARILLVGDGELRPQIENILKRDGVYDQCIITGYIPYKSIPEHLAACDVLLSPCINNEDRDFFNSPVKLFEYMSMSKPVVATRVGQQSDVISDGINGLLCEEKQPEALSESIFKVKQDNDLAERISKAARQTVIDKYTWVENAKIIIKAYHDRAAKK
ncbi:MAG: hypothetical protein QG635_1693 [Bacteroidota bacterium]|nr:hypothetical protein [Bacteroidota bacterium]